MIEARGLTKRFGDRVVVDRLDLSVGAGELYALLGGNGAGKTTTLHVLLGLLTADEGEVHIDGTRVGTGARPRVAYVPEVVDLYPDLDPIETLELFAAVAGRDASVAELVGALDRAGLDRGHHRRRLRVFSKGMRQKVALAAAELQGARALVLDEPTSGLDPVAADQLMTRLASLCAEGAAVLISTHDVHLVARVATRVGVLRDGRLIAERSAGDLAVDTLPAMYRALVAHGEATP